MQLKFILIGIFLFLYSISYAQYCIENRFNTNAFTTTQIQIISNIKYGEAINASNELENLGLDIYMPDTSIDDLNQRPLVLFVHGGGLVGGNKTSGGAVTIAEDFAQKGFVVASIDYRLGWDVGDGYCDGDTTSLMYAIYRAQQDINASIRFIKEKASEYQIDTNAIFLMGNSVGSTLALQATFATQSDFPNYLYEQFGSVDSATNSYYNHSRNVLGASLIAGGVFNPNIVTNKNIPTQFFHGTCDQVVPYIDGPLYQCFEPVKYPLFYGAWYLSKTMQVNNQLYELYTNEGYDHEAVDLDTAILYSSEFIKKILCGTFNASNEIYKYNYGGCLAENATDIFLHFFPNPFVDQFIVSVNSAKQQSIEISITSITGQIIFTSTNMFYSPVTQYALDIEKYNLARGLYILRIHSETSETTAIIEKF